jgi:A/G-specific adenine glycosylase
VLLHKGHKTLNKRDNARSGRDDTWGVQRRDAASDGRTVAFNPDARWLADLRERLVGWYADAQRRLPWRADHDPYRILVSEMMLVQTTVTAVIPYFERFLSRFPDFRALAAATEAEVLKAWEGLGYYRRARQLHATARTVVQQHGGVMPDDPIAVQALPGVGRYVAGAILSFAYDRPQPIVEANSQRVLARLLAIKADLKTSATRERIWRAAERLVPTEGAGSFNQALIELGALVCTPRQPACLVCPVAGLCEARRLGLQDLLPVMTPKPAPLAVTEACAIVRRDACVLIVQRGLGGLWEQFWEFPTIHVDGVDPAGRSFGAPVDLAEGVKRLTGIRIGPAAPVKSINYSVTNHRVKLVAHMANARSGTLKPGPGLVDARWVEAARLHEYTFSSASRRLIASIHRDSK